MNQARTVGELRQGGYQPKSVKQELRDNLIARLRKGEAIFPGIVGYEESVLPQIENAILSGQDIVFLGERGQAKTRMARLLIELLDAEVLGLAGCEVNDNPFAPICQACRERVAERGDKAEVTWIPRDRRCGEKLATAAITLAGLIGEAAYMQEIVAELTHLARKAPEISQRSGVSVRVSICNWENLLSNALKRAIRLDEREVAPRVSDLGAIVASTSGKIEMETLGDGGEDNVLGKLVQKAVLNVFNRSFTGGELDPVIAAIQDGFGIEVADMMPSKEYVRQIAEIRPLHAAVKKLGASDPASTAAALEFVLEGLHLSRKLNKDTKAGRYRYRS